MIAGVLPAVAAGAVTGLGLTLVITAISPAPVSLEAALARLDGRDNAAGSWQSSAAPGGAGRRAAAWLSRAGRFAIPHADLALLGRTPEQFMARKLAGGLAGLVSFALGGALLTLAGISLPWEAPAGAALVTGAGLFFLPDADTRADAARRRRDWRHGWCAYLQLIRLAVKGGAGTSDALGSAAAIGNGWVFRRIQAALESAGTAHEPLWQGLARLGRDIGAAEVSELADTIRVAGAEGTRIADTIAAAAGSLRQQLITEDRAQLNGRTVTMILPGAVMALGFIVLLGFPFYYQLIHLG